MNPTYVIKWKDSNETIVALYSVPPDMTLDENALLRWYAEHYDFSYNEICIEKVSNLSINVAIAVKS